MDFTPLTPEQYQKARDAGFSHEKIIENEQIRKSQSTGPAIDSEKSIGGFLGNVVKSGADLVTGTADALIHLPRTLETLGKTGLGVIQKAIPGEQEDEKYANALGQFYKERYGGLSNIGNTLYNDPVGAALDVATFASGGAGAVGKLGTTSKLGKAARIVEDVSRAVDPLNAPGAILRKTKGLVTPTLEKSAQKLEALNLRMTPSAKNKLIMKESTFDRIPELSDTDVVKYGASKKLVGTPEDRVLQHQQVIDDLESVLDEATKSSKQVTPKSQIISELQKIVDSYKGKPTQYKAIKGVIDEKIAMIKDRGFIPGKYLTQEALQNLKRDAWSASKFDTTVSNNARNAERMAGHVFKNAIEDAFERGKELVAGKKAADFNTEYGTALGYQKLLEKALGKSELGITGRALGAYTGKKVSDLFGGGPIADVAGAMAGEKLAPKILGTKVRSKVGKYLMEVSEGKKPSKVRSFLTNTAKKGARAGFYSKQIDERVNR